MAEGAGFKALSRRGFIKLGGLGIAAFAASPGWLRVPPGEGKIPAPIGRARVATGAIYRYSQPDFQSERLGIIQRDELLTIYGLHRSPQGPAHNPFWCELFDGYVYSGNLQRIDHTHLNPHPLEHVPEGGCLGEITVPYTDSQRYTSSRVWQPLYRLYYQSVYWITALDEGPDGLPWYQITDDLLHARLHVPAAHIRPVQSEELAPISNHVPPEEKRIEISLSAQTLTAYEAGERVLHTPISTGIPSEGPSPNGIPTDTPPGRYHVQTKMPSRHMGDGRLTSDRDAYELPGVPWVCFFHKDGLALHGTYWHSNFGRRMSHGCVNLPNPAALWLYRWTTPVASAQDWYSRGWGTVIDVLES